MRRYNGMAITREYTRYRDRGWPASEAWRAARVRYDWYQEEGDRVKLEAEPDPERYDDSYLETWGLSPEKLELARKQLWETIETEGVWIYTSYFRRNVGDEWIAVDSIGGCIGDLEGSGYEIDLFNAALNALYSEPSLTSKYG